MLQLVLVFVMFPEFEAPLLIVVYALFIYSWYDYSYCG
jgi:hypothetical protein